jgi:hypothetical protein
MTHETQGVRLEQTNPDHYPSVHKALNSAARIGWGRRRGGDGVDGGAGGDGDVGGGVVVVGL